MNVCGTPSALMYSRISSFWRTLCQRGVRVQQRKGSTGVGTYLVVERTDALRPRRAKIARNDALDADLLRRTDDIALLADRRRNDGADEDVRACEGLLEALDAVAQVSRPDLYAARTQVGDRGFREGRGTYKGRDALDRGTNVPIGGSGLYSEVGYLW